MSLSMVTQLVEVRFIPRSLIPGFIMESLNSVASQFKPVKMHNLSICGFWFLVFRVKLDSVLGDMT